MNRRGEAGFTLIETLVALAILAPAAMAILGATQSHLRNVQALETRAAAQLATENYLAELIVGGTPDPAPAPIMAIAFRIAETRRPTSDPGLEQVDLVTTDVAGGQVAARLTGFLLRRDAP